MAGPHATLWRPWGTELSTKMMRRMTITFPNGNQAQAVYVPAGVDGAAIAAALELPRPCAVLLLSGGASKMPTAGVGRLRRLLAEGLARVAAEEGITIIDGGTQAGVMQMMGEARATVGGDFPLIGVCPAALVSWPGGPVGLNLVPLEPHHTHFALVPGARWGDENEKLQDLATVLSQGVLSLTVLANGGKISRDDVLRSARAKREIIVLRGSGLLADELAASITVGTEPPDDEAAAIVRSGHLTLFEVTDGPEALVALIRRRLLVYQPPMAVEGDKDG